MAYLLLIKINLWLNYSFMNNILLKMKIIYDSTMLYETWKFNQNKSIIKGTSQLHTVFFLC